MLYRVFFNSDCAKYGVQAFKSNISYQGDSPRWSQVLIKDGREVAPFQARNPKAYIPYKAVAMRWKRQLEAHND